MNQKQKEKDRLCCKNWRENNRARMKELNKNNYNKTKQARAILKRFEAYQNYINNSPRYIRDDEFPDVNEDPTKDQMEVMGLISNIHFVDKMFSNKYKEVLINNEGKYRFYHRQKNRYINDLGGVKAIAGIIRCPYLKEDNPSIDIEWEFPLFSALSEIVNYRAQYKLYKFINSIYDFDI